MWMWHHARGGDSRRLNPALFPNTVMNAGAGLAALQLRVKGPNAALSCGQASGLAALCFAHDIVGSGLADMMIAGGAEELEQPLLDGYAAARRIAPHNSSLGVEVCAPFDVRRSGPILGEGATFLVLEALDSALARGARIYAEVAGWAGNADQPVLRGWDPTGEGLSECMLRPGRIPIMISERRLRSIRCSAATGFRSRRWRRELECLQPLRRLLRLPAYLG